MMRRRNTTCTSTSEIVDDDFDVSYQERMEQQDRANFIWDIALTVAKEQQQNKQVNEINNINNEGILRLLAFESSSITNINIIPLNNFCRHFISSTSSTTVHARPIRQSTEVTALQSVGCSCINEDDWNNIILLFTRTTNTTSDSTVPDSTADVSDLLKRHVSNVIFHGIVVLIISQQDISDATSGDNSAVDTSIKGIHNCRLVSNSIIDLTNVSIYQCMEISYCCIYGTHFTSGSTDTDDCGTATVSVTKVWNCGTVTCLKQQQQQQQYKQKEYQLNNNRTITVGPETAGGYELTVQPESTMIEIGDQILNYPLMKQNKPIHPTHDHNKMFTIISSGCSVQSTTLIDNVYLYSNCIIDSVHTVQNVIMMNESTIRNGCCVQNVTMQWKTVIELNSTVTNVHIMEQSHIGPNSHINTSIIGCDVHVSNGEIHSSIIGSNTAAHHQSLIISVLWLTGRGNVGYGANVGSNHTGRLPDQCITCSEGIFWGLSCIITMPIDLSCSPYTLIAAGTQLNSGRCTMPFSLILGNANSSSTSSTIIPGWLLKSSPYTIERNEIKFSTRRKAKRHMKYTGTSIIRYQTIHLCFIARHELQYRINNNINTSIKKTIVLPKSFTTYPISNDTCKKGIDIYTDTIQRYALIGLYEKLLQHRLHTASSNIANQQGHYIIQSIISSLFDVGVSKNDNNNFINESNLWSSGIFHQTTSSLSSSSSPPEESNNSNEVRWPKLPWQIQEDDDLVWSYRQFLLRYEFTNLLQEQQKNNRTTSTTTATTTTTCVQICNWLIQKYVQLESSYAKNVISSKERDDIRGAQLIPGYSESHSNSKNDPIIQQIQQRVHIVVYNVQQIQQLYLDANTSTNTTCMLTSTSRL